MNENRYCVIMCGGVGSRFWPKSRFRKPKQFLDFFGTGRSLLQMTYDRILPLCRKENIILVTNVAYLNIIHEQLPEIAPENILLEPAGRNTAPCVCWAAHNIQARNPNAVIATVPSDHLILREDRFISTMEECFSFASGCDALLTIGIKPTHPHTGYGYIQLGAEVKDCPGIRKVKSFTEKPNLEMARLLVESGEFYWNSGMFIWRTDAILKAFEKCAPEIAAIFDSIEYCYNTPAEQAVVDEVFSNSPSISIDYAIMEKTRNAYVKTADLGWSDLGSWKALYDNSPKNQQRNVTQKSMVLANDCEGSVFAGETGKIIVAAGLKDYIVADTEKALLIYPIAEEQKIRQVMNEVKDRFGEEYV